MSEQKPKLTIDKIKFRGSRAHLLTRSAMQDLIVEQAEKIRDLEAQVEDRGVMLQDEWLESLYEKSNIGQIKHEGHTFYIVHREIYVELDIIKDVINTSPDGQQKEGVFIPTSDIRDVVKNDVMLEIPSEKGELLLMKAERYAEMVNGIRRTLEDLTTRPGREHTNALDKLQESMKEKTSGETSGQLDSGLHGADE